MEYFMGKCGDLPDPASLSNVRGTLDRLVRCVLDDRSPVHGLADQKTDLTC